MFGRRNITIIYQLIIVFTLFSCSKDFLDVPDKTVLIRQAYVVDLKTTSDYLNGIYVNLSTVFLEGETIIYPEIISDNIKPVSGSQSFFSHYSWNQQGNDDNSSTLNPSTRNANGLWFSGYGLIRDCSFAIDAAEKFESENVELANAIKGQAYGIRALVHFYLVNVFAQSYNFSNDGAHIGIPYITTSDFTQKVSRSSVSNVYDLMLADLTNASNLLQSSDLDVLHFGKTAVDALLSRIYLFKGDYKNALTYAERVIKVVPLMTEKNGYPQKLFTQKEAEALFQLPPAYVGIPGSAGEYYTDFAGLLFTDPLLYYLPTEDVVDVLQEDSADVRSSWVTNSNGKWLINKYPKDVIPGFYFPSASYYQTILRSSELYLTAAEASAKLNDEAKATFYLDNVRLRANPKSKGTTTTGAALLDLIYKERRKELSFEGLRMFDIQRWKMDIIRKDPLTTSASKLIYPNSKSIAPIPLQDVNLSGLQQNNGY